MPKPVSKQIRSSFHPSVGLGKDHRSPGMTRFGGSGWGVPKHDMGKDRRFVSPKVMDPAPAGKPRDLPMANTTKTLSPHWRPFALADGGVLFIHPTRNQVMEWNREVMKRENEATGLSGFDREVDAKIQTLIADNTLEHVSLREWRKNMMRRLVTRQSGLERDYMAYPRSGLLGGIANFSTHRNESTK